MWYLYYKSEEKNRCLRDSSAGAKKFELKEVKSKKLLARLESCGWVYVQEIIV